MNRRGTGYERPRRPAGADAVSGLDLRRQRDQELMRRVDQQARAVAAQAEAEVRECITANLQNGQAGVRDCVTQLISGNAQEQEVVYGGVEHDSTEQVLLERTTSSTSISSSSSSSLSGMVSLRHKSVPKRRSPRSAHGHGRGPRSATTSTSPAVRHAVRAR